MVADREERSVKRRGAIKWIGAGSVTALAGCSTDSSTGGPQTDEEEDDNDDYPAEPSDPEYSPELNLQDSYDSTDSQVLDLTEDIQIEKILNGEAELVGSDDYEIVEAYQVRDHDDYNTKFFKDNEVLYEEITQEVQNNELTTNDLLPGQTRVGLEISVEDDETVNVEAGTEVLADQETLQERAFIQDEELWEDMREEYLEEELKNTYDDFFWGLANDLEENLMPEIQDKDITRQYVLIAREWIDRTKRHTGRAGLSTDAHWLTNTLEYLIDSTYGIRNQDTFHNSTIAWNKEEGHTAGVENRRLGETAVPPKDLRFLFAEREGNRDRGRNSLLNPDSNQMRGTLSSIGELTRPLQWSRISFGEDYRETAAERLLNDERVGELYNFHKPLGLSRELNQSMKFHVKGTADSPELEIEQ